MKIHSSQVTSTTPNHQIHISSGSDSPQMTTNHVHITDNQHQHQTIQIQQQPQTIQIHHQSPNQNLANAQVCLDSVQLTDVDVRTNYTVLIELVHDGWVDDVD